MKEKDIIGLITKDYSWEQVLYKIIAWEGLDPWDLDIVKLSSVFLDCLEKTEQVDFKVPAKYVVIASVLLRMKSEHLHFIDWLTNPEEGIEEVGGEIDSQQDSGPPENFEVNPITVPPGRQVKRKITANELVLALRKVLNTQEKRTVTNKKARKLIKIEDSNIEERIAKLHERINLMLDKIKEEELRFSEVVDEWKRESIIENFIPLIYLDNEKKIKCRQEDLFKEIFIKRHFPEDSPKSRAKTYGQKMRRMVPV